MFLFIMEVAKYFQTVVVTAGESARLLGAERLRAFLEPDLPPVWHVGECIMYRQHPFQRHIHWCCRGTGA